MTSFKRFFFLILLYSNSTFAQQTNIINKEKNFTAFSNAVTSDGNLPKLYSCDSAGISPTISWTSAPANTKSFVVTMHHISKDGEQHVYLVLYNIPENTSMIPDAVQGIGKFGINTVNRRNSYTPPCSKGPGPKQYIITVYALSESPEITVASSSVTMDVLINAMKDKILASSEIKVTYSR